MGGLSTPTVDDPSSRSTSATTDGPSGHSAGADQRSFTRSAAYTAVDRSNAARASREGLMLCFPSSFLDLDLTPLAPLSLKGEGGISRLDTWCPAETEQGSPSCPPHPSSLSPSRLAPRASSLLISLGLRNNLIHDLARTT